MAAAHLGWSHRFPHLPGCGSSARLTASSSPRHNPSRNASTSRTSSAAHSNHSIITRRKAWRSSLLGNRKARRASCHALASSVISVVRKPDRYSAVHMPSSGETSGSAVPKQSWDLSAPMGLEQIEQEPKGDQDSSQQTTLLRQSAYPYRSARTGAVQPRSRKPITRAGLEQ